MRCSRIQTNYQKALDDPDYLGKQYYTTLMNSHLCAEPEIIQMMVEWKESVINNYFKGARSDYDITIEELFNKQIHMMCNNILIPSVWVGNMYDAIESKSYLQYCAIYLMNLLILQTITKENQKGIISIKDWTYISQFWKMNIQEAALLKFTSLFNIKKKKDEVFIEKKRIVGKLEQKNKLETQLDIFNFLQDDISYNLYMLHNPEVSNNKKQEYRTNLSEQGIDVRFEIILGQVHEYLLNNNIRFSLEKNVEEGCEILYNYKIDDFLVLDWLVCINMCQNDFPHTDLYTRRSRRIVDIIIEKYEDNVHIMLEMFKYMEKSGSHTTLKRISRLYHYNIEKWIYSNPEIALEIFIITSRYMAAEQLQLILDKVSKNMFDIFIKAPKATIELFNTFSSVDNIQLYDELIMKLLHSLDKVYYSSPKAIIELARLCILQGKEHEFVRIIEYEWVGLEKLIYLEPETAVELLEIVQMLGKNEEFVRKNICNIIRSFERSTDQHPEALVKAIRLALTSEDVQAYEEMVRYVVRRYNVIFKQSPREAINCLKLINSNKDLIEIREVLKYSFDRYYFLMSNSIDAAIDLLILTQEIFKHTDDYIIICLNYILYNEINVDYVILFELLDNLREEHLYNLAGYFINKYFYIVLKYPNLAKKIADIYCKTKWKGEFFDVIYDLEENSYINREYILELKNKLL